ncbi:MAG: DUF4258 domain-containing protein [Aquificaceae bacterium]
MLRVKITPHFEKRWNERGKFMESLGITIEKILYYIHNPDLVLDDPLYPDRKYYVKRVEGRCLKVVVEHREDILTPITVFFDRALRKKGICG